MREYRRQSKTLSAINSVSPTGNERPALVVASAVLLAFDGICGHEAQHPSVFTDASQQNNLKRGGR
jgi:hypothetical protein